jgi:hypothetical protein
MEITLEAIRKILDEELDAGINESIRGTYGFVSGKDEAARKLYDLFMKKPSIKTFTVYWRDGKKEVLKGRTFADALNQAGYGQGALPALDFYDDVGTFKYTWNETTKHWDKA